MDSVEIEFENQPVCIPYADVPPKEDAIADLINTNGM